jgi:hypothetical protein
VYILAGMRVFAIAPSMVLHLALVLVGCSGAAVRTPTRANQLRVVEWTLGGQNAAAPTSPEAFLILIPKEKLAPKPSPNAPKPARPETKPQATGAATGVSTALSECIRASSFLPLPSQDGRILMTVEGAIYALEDGSRVPQRLESQGSPLHVIKMIASRPTAEGLEVLAVGQMPDRDDILHSVVIRGNRVVRSSVADVPYENAASFFNVYDVPRCSDRGSACLRISRDDDGTYVEEWMRGAREPPATLIKINGAQDAAWDSTDDGALLVLKTCM